MTQLSLDLSAGLKRKREGIAKAASHEPTFHSIMVAVAIKHSMEHGCVTSDDLRIYAEQHGIQPSSKNAWGTIFSGKCWMKIGERPSIIASNHGHRNPIWKYVSIQSNSIEGEN